MLNVNQARLRLLRCAAGGETYCLDTDAVRSIERTDLMQLNPGKDGPTGWLLGTKEEIPVFSLTDRLNLPRTAGDPTGRVIVLQSTLGPWGLLVDRVSGFMKAAPQDMTELPSESLDETGNFFKGLIKVDEELVLYLDPAALHPCAPIVAPDPVGIRTPGRDQGGSKESQGKVVLFSTPSAAGASEEIIFGLSLTQVLQILDPLPMMSLPTSSTSRVLGIVNWRSCPVPLIDLNACLGLGQVRASEVRRLLIARATGGFELVAFGVNPSVRMQSLPLEYIGEGARVRVNSSMVKAAYTFAGQTLVIPDLDRIAAHDLREELTTVQEAVPMPALA